MLTIETIKTRLVRSALQAQKGDYNPLASISAIEQEMDHFCNNNPLSYETNVFKKGKKIILHIYIYDHFFQIPHNLNINI